ncbi:MAG: BLUF domain-containing protein [Prochloron sp. SP5CPC1]|nr:BLUF domain-containing protein [Candidatus Paraprochloron terpiosi SP5CPC1]
MTLHRLIYCSNAIHNLEYPDLKDIMDKSEKNNTPEGITGILCYGNDMFLQVLEGHRKRISNTYARIANDKRHFNAELIEFYEIEHRLFVQWSMKVVQLGTYSQDKIRKLNLKYSSSTAFSPVLMNAKQCLNFLLELNSL